MRDARCAMVLRPSPVLSPSVHWIWPFLASRVPRSTHERAGRDRNRTRRHLLPVSHYSHLLCQQRRARPRRLALSQRLVAEAPAELLLLALGTLAPAARETKSTLARPRDELSLRVVVIWHFVVVVVVARCYSKEHWIADPRLEY